VKPILVLAVGNPSRGDDALGPLLVERLQALDLPDVELLTDFQLQVEYVLDLHGRQSVVFVDAAASGPAPYTFSAIGPADDSSYSSHALSPQALLAAYVRHYATPPPSAFLLAVQGYDFELGQALSPDGAKNLEAALNHLMGRLASSDADRNRLLEHQKQNGHPKVAVSSD
jgi:hydrogenase maturation protease